MTTPRWVTLEDGGALALYEDVGPHGEDKVLQGRRDNF